MTSFQVANSFRNLTACFKKRKMHDLLNDCLFDVDFKKGLWVDEDVKSFFVEKDENFFDRGIERCC